MTEQSLNLAADAWYTSTHTLKCVCPSSKVSRKMPRADGHMIISYSRTTLRVDRKVKKQFLSSSEVVGTL